MLNIVIPMAGRGSRFSNAGFTIPKPFIAAQGKPMIQLVVENLRPSVSHRFIFICQNEHIRDYDFERKLSEISPGCLIIGIDGVTEGAACTVLTAKSYINNSDSLMIANCDQYVATKMDSYLEEMDKGSYDGYIMTMKANDKKWSYIRFGLDNEITEVVEKVVVSDEATVGIYNYKAGNYFVEAAEKMIAGNHRVNGEFYVAPAYNFMISNGQRIGYFNVGSERNGMFGLGIPEDLEYFNSLDRLP